MRGPDVDVEYWLGRVEGWVLVAYGDGPGRPVHVRGYLGPRPEPVHVLTIRDPDTPHPVYEWHGPWPGSPRAAAHVAHRALTGYRDHTHPPAPAGYRGPRCPTCHGTGHLPTHPPNNDHNLDR